MKKNKQEEGEEVLLDDELCGSLVRSSTVHYSPSVCVQDSEINNSFLGLGSDRFPEQ